MSAAGVIVADTSALVAIVFAEPERQAFVRTIQEADKVLLKGDDFSRTDIAGLP